MTSLAPPLSVSSVRPRLSHKLALALVLTALADFLFYGERPGISVIVFALALIAGTLLANLDQLERRRTLLAVGITLAGLLPVIEEFNFLSFCIAAFALCIVVSILTDAKPQQWTERLRASWQLLLTGPVRLAHDTVSVLDVSAIGAGFVIWLVPIGLGIVFVILFASANPLIEQWILRLDPSNAAAHLDGWRMAFWAIAACLVWPFVHVRWRDRKPKPSAATEPAADASAASPAGPAFLGEATILRSLLLFNLLFAVQTVLDLVYLWGDRTLPSGVTYADYAHRGAYPLILTALLAAAFVLVAMRPGGPGERSRTIRPLVYLFVAQNLALVISSIQRLRLYTEIYLLTTWRVAAFIWMLLVAIGLVLITARIVLARSNGWLVRTNLIGLVATLYVCSLTNFDAIIADYNVAHSREAGGKGVEIDLCYLYRLGPQALPAIDRALGMKALLPRVVEGRDNLAQQQRQNMASWRSWGFRGYRLQRYLDQHDKPVAAG
jgi:hypothetical protein